MLQQLTSCETLARDRQRFQRTEQALVSLIGPAWGIDLASKIDRSPIDLASLIERDLRIDRSPIDR